MSQKVVHQSMLEFPTRFGPMPTKYLTLTHATAASRLAVVFPGQSYPLDAPLMWYAAKAAFAAGCDVVGVEYGYQANRGELSVEQIGDLVDEAVSALRTVVTAQYESVVFIGKSIGTIVQSEAARKVSFPVRHHVYLTPLRPVIPAIRQSERALVVVGDKDGAFGPAEIAEVTGLHNVQLQVVPDADHGLETDDFSTSLDILKQTATWCGDFCKDAL